jgi:hypothetical protein
MNSAYSSSLTSLFLGGILALGCGGTSSSAVECGPGTVLNGAGQCVPAEQDSGVAGSGGADSSVADSAAGSGGADSGDSATDVGPQDSAPTDTSVDVNKGSCPQNLAGPKLVEVSTPDGSRYCIDATEVTLAQYGKFIDTKQKIGTTDEYDMSGEPSVCSENKTYLDWPKDALNPQSTDEPVRYTDWCDAYMYCQWAGKRLCGKVGGGALPLQDSSAYPNSNEWYNACSSGGKFLYPYGNDFQPDACVTGVNATEAKPVASMSGCHGTQSPFDQIFDMSGNVFEWGASCDSEKCATYGGAFATKPGLGGVECTTVFNTLRTSTHEGALGFRCCADIVTSN